MAERMTKRDYFMALIGIVEASDYADKEGAIAFIEHEIELLNRKSGKNGMTKTQKENVGISETIKAVLADMGKAVTISEMMADERLAAYSNQKLSALVSQLVKVGEVVRTKDKRKAYFAIAE